MDCRYGTKEVRLALDGALWDIGADDLSTFFLGNVFVAARGITFVSVRQCRCKGDGGSR